VRSRAGKRDVLSQEAVLRYKKTGVMPVFLYAVCALFYELFVCRLIAQRLNRKDRFLRLTRAVFSAG
ncbi:MAG: hypothetical protein ACRC8L_00880, partial [Plesiomonas shigelloides]